MLYGVECSGNQEDKLRELKKFLQKIKVIPFSFAKYQYARGLARLKRQGTPIDDFDLLIGCTAVAGNMVMVTDNVKHFDRIQGIDLENWIER